MSRIYSEGESFKGRREQNQDSYICIALDNNFYFVAVADGMGGANAGEVASQLVIEKSVDFLRKRLIQPTSPEEMKLVLSEMFHYLQDIIRKKIKEEPEYSGMGTTLSCALIHDNKYVWANIGDTRIYIFNHGDCDLLTEDHTPVQEYIKQHKHEVPGDILNRYSNILTRCLDGGNQEPNIYPTHKDYQILEELDLLMICSDGLILNKANPDITIFNKYIYSATSKKQAIEELYNYAINNGSSDNITILLTEYKENDTTVCEEPAPLPVASVKMNVRKTASLREKLKLKPKYIYLLLSFLILLICIIVILKNPVIMVSSQEYFSGLFQHQNDSSSSDNKISQVNDSDSILHFPSTVLDTVQNKFFLFRETHEKVYYLAIDYFDDSSKINVRILGLSGQGDTLYNKGHMFNLIESPDTITP
jgi:protein phosphatase